MSEASIAPSSISIHGFDNIPKCVLGTINLLATIGPCTITIPYHVMPNNLNYNILLGQPWIHAMHAIPSTLHAQLKFHHQGIVYDVPADPPPLEYFNFVEQSSDTSYDII